jgi:hypothetical protein
LFSLFDRQYWKRLWVVQEIAAHPSAQIILCGQQELRAKLFSSACMAITESVEQVEGDLRLALWSERYIFWVTTMKRAMMICIISRYLEAAPTLSLGFSFEVAAPLMLSLSKSAQQSDMRDKVYGILGMVDPGITSKIEPDYQSSVPQVLIAFTKAVITSTNSLELLRRARPSVAQSYILHNNLCLPSWVEDLTCDDVLQNMDATGTKYPDMYSAGGKTPFNIRFSDQDTAFSCQGIVLDSIDGMGVPTSTREANPPNRTIARPSQIQNAYFSEAATGDALWRTLVGNRNNRVGTGSMPPDTWKEILNVLYRIDSYNDDSYNLLSSYPELSKFCSYPELSNFFSRNREMTLYGKTLPYWLDTRNCFGSTSPPLSKSEISHILQCTRINLMYRKLMTTVRGYLGLVPDIAELGDVICVLPGCSTPLIIRPGMGGYFNLIGECYVHGLMEGEVMEWLESGEVQLKTINLK